jgi:hypothetical protein
MAIIEILKLTLGSVGFEYLLADVQSYDMKSRRKSLLLYTLS